MFDELQKRLKNGGCKSDGKPTETIVDKALWIKGNILFGVRNGKEIENNNFQCIKNLTILLLLISNLTALSQLEFTNQYKKDNLIDSTFTIMNENTLIEGVYIGDNSKEKPLIIFVQGSGIRPVFGLGEDRNMMFMLPMEILNSVNNYILLSKPGIPLVCNLDRLDNHYNYLTKDSIPPDLYLKTNNLEYYVGLYSNLINHIEEKFSYSQLVIIGHSQGARIAAEFCLTTKVDKVVYMSADPLGRMGGVMDRVYANVEDREKEKIG